MKKPVLLVMRLADMTRMHPDQIVDKCPKCGEAVGIYPSGQKLMREVPGGVELVCQVCREPADVQILAPGALEEPAQSVRKQ